MQATSVTPEANDRFSVGPCLDHQAVLGTGGKMLLWGTRVMISAAENNRCYRAEVEQVFFKAGIPEILVSWQDALATVALGASRQVMVGEVEQGSLTQDEQRLLWPIARLQQHPNQCACSPIREICHGAAVQSIMCRLNRISALLSTKELYVANFQQPHSVSLAIH
ncbi:MAG: hypothetical protein AAGB27_10445 [Pseudomonadota bacterium]